MLVPFLKLLLGGGVMFVAYFFILFVVLGQKEIFMEIYRGLRGIPVDKRDVAADTAI